MTEEKCSCGCGCDCGCDCDCCCECNTDKEIAFDFKRYVLTVKGDALIMPYLEDSEVGIKGIIKTLDLKYKMGNNNV